MRASVAVLAGLAAASGALFWLLFDLSDLAEPVDWRPSGERLGGLDHAEGRQRQVHRLLTGLDRPGAGAHLQSHLAALAADRCGTRELPPELAAALAADPSAARLDEPEQLAHLLTLIESLPGDTDR